MAGLKGTNPTLLIAERLHCFESGTRGVHVIWCSWSCSLRQVRTMAEGALQWARDAQGETNGQIEQRVFFLLGVA